MSKFTYRTRSKVSFSDRTILDLESNLPNDLLENPNTPDSKETEEIWLQFLTHFNEGETGGIFDEQDDPDFTFPERALELIENESESQDQIRIPRSEAIELVKDAAEFVGDTSLLYDPEKVFSLLSNENTIDDSINELATDEQSQSQNNPTVQHTTQETTSTATASPNEYIPQFTESQRMQLDEQLRNHVQLLTQTCLLCVDKKNEFKTVHSDALALLNMLNDLSKNSNSIKILNLEEGLKLVNENKTFINNKNDDSSTATSNEQEYMPQKYLELIVTSPVFYNSKLIPSLKYKFQSQFTKTLFSDVELRLVLMGYEKFGHLSLVECSECIHKHLIPSRKVTEIGKKLNDILKTEERKHKFMSVLKEPLPRYGLKFNKESDYKALVDRTDIAKLPSMYTVIIERLHLASLIEERKRLDEIKKKNPEKKVPKRHGEPSEWLKERLNDIEIIEPTTSSQNKQVSRSVSNFAQTSSTTTKTTTPAATQKSASLLQSPVIFATDLNKILCNATNNQATSNGGALMNNLPFNLPANFQGTIMIQPTIHIHTNEQFIRNEITKFRQIMPRDGGVDQQTNKRRKI